MQLTKFTHACVRLDDGDRSLVIDPGVFSEGAQALDGAGAVPESVTAALTDLGDQVVTVSPGDSFEAGGFPVTAHGGQHAVIHPTIPVIANVGYLVAGVYHPGDSFYVPSEPVQTLLVPSNAPWSKAAEVIDFTVAVRAPRAHQIHDSLVTDVYAGMVEGHLQRIAGPHGVEFAHLKPTESVTV
jgi:L-ascorbate metabolism protein UlaG (beta-lactamase superfamily)